MRNKTGATIACMRMETSINANDKQIAADSVEHKIQIDRE